MEISKDNETNLRSEAKVIAKVYNNYEKLKDVDIAKFSAQNEKDANQLIDDAFSSPIIGGITTELVTEVANVWTAAEPSEFIGVAKPEMNQDLVETFDTLLMSLRTSSKDDFKNDLKVIVSTVKVAADYHVTEKMTSTDTDTIVSVIGQDGCMETIIGTLASGKATKQAIPTLVEFGLSYGYKAVGLDGVEAKVNKTADQVNWGREKVVLGNLFEGVSTTYLSTKQDGALINKLDFVGMAKVLNALRDSELLSDSSQEISVKLLSSKLTAGIDVGTLVSYIENDNTYQDMNFEVMLTTLKSSANIASDMKDIIAGSSEVTELNPNDVGTFLNGLTSDDTTKDVLKDLASESNLQKAGADSKTASAVNGLVDSITNYDTTQAGAVQVPTSTEDLQSATNAVEKVIKVSSGANDLSTDYIFGADELTAKAGMTEFIETLLSSDFIYASTINGGESLGFKAGETSNLSVSEQGWLIEVRKSVV